jgi:alanine dehydrogenase
MLVGAPKETKDNEFRVGLTPATVDELTHRGHGVIIEKSAGVGSGLTDDEYSNAGAKIVDTPQEIFARAEMVVKVKEPQAAERKMLRRGQILFTYLHLAPDLVQTQDLISSPDISQSLGASGQRIRENCCVATIYPRLAERSDADRV